MLEFGLYACCRSLESGAAVRAVRSHLNVCARVNACACVRACLFSRSLITMVLRTFPFPQENSGRGREKVRESESDGKSRKDFDFKGPRQWYTKKVHKIFPLKAKIHLWISYIMDVIIYTCDSLSLNFHNLYNGPRKTNSIINIFVLCWFRHRTPLRGHKMTDGTKRKKNNA